MSRMTRSLGRGRPCRFRYFVKLVRISSMLAPMKSALLISFSLLVARPEMVTARFETPRFRSSSTRLTSA